MSTNGSPTKKLQRNYVRWITPWLVLFGLALVLGGWLEYQSQATRATIGRIELERLERQAVIVSNEVSQQLRATSGALDAIRDLVKDGKFSRNNEDISQALGAVQRSSIGVRSFVLVDANGLILSASSPEVIGVDLSNSERFKALRALNDPQVLQISAPFVTSLGVYTISAGKVILGPEGQFLGCVIAVIDPQYFQNLLSVTRHSRDGASFIILADGKIVQSVHDAEGRLASELLHRPQSLFWKFLESKLAGQVAVGSIDESGDDGIVVFRLIAPESTKLEKPLVYANSLSFESIFAASYKNQVVNRWLFIGCLLLGAFATAFFQWRRVQVRRIKLAALRERKAANERLMRVHHLLRMSEIASKSGAWHWDIKADTLTWSDQLYELFGLKAEANPPSFATWRAIVHPDDLEAAEATLHNALIRREVFDSTYRIRMPSGEVKWIDAVGTPTYDESGESVGFSGICIDRTARHKAESHINQMYHLLTTAERAARAGAWTWTFSDDRLVWSDQLFELFGLDPEKDSASFETWRSILYPDDLESANAKIEQSIQQRKLFYTEYRIVRPKDGRVLRIHAYGSPSFDSEGKPKQFSGICVDATQQYIARSDGKQH